jgi:hypothetical protein
MTTHTNFTSLSVDINIPADAIIEEVTSEISVGLFNDVRYVGVYFGTDVRLQEFSIKMMLCSSFDSANQISNIMFRRDRDNVSIVAVITPNRSKTARIYRKILNK